MSTTGQLRKLGAALCLIAGLTAFGSAFAQEKSVNIDNAVYQEIEVVRPDGTVEIKRAPATKVVPGDTVIYEITYRNSGDQPATDVVVGIPVPAELVFIDDGETPVSALSVDGGEHYGALAALTVLDAEGDERPAEASDVTDLRWTIGSLAPGASGKVSFRARVK